MLNKRKHKQTTVCIHFKRRESECAVRTQDDLSLGGRGWKRVSVTANVYCLHLIVGYTGVLCIYKCILYTHSFH